MTNFILNQPRWFQICSEIKGNSTTELAMHSMPLLRVEVKDEVQRARTERCQLEVLDEEKADMHTTKLLSNSLPANNTFFSLTHTSLAENCISLKFWLVWWVWALWFYNWSWSYFIFDKKSLRALDRQSLAMSSNFILGKKWISKKLLWVIMKSPNICMYSRDTNCHLSKFNSDGNSVL